ncbi:type I-D CRISPR-associated protein Cas7/Csc2 [Roseomonas marmotae]|uniref:Type I-D CRISPR-associated protein Cas7/Csc2 n=1 Tax=Roseomonas marmotae TaxID=2768161 RepID=A0ABS3KL86_9PROT|nr:type I-D CRISPR-associated protein Cas7/Csc2 [Roseomonas marmotae]MBO1077091.1 type I-D CRISPR-associated protein Cas7/Csc2 [Roseomonas marmotae]QTI82161.1 type I-D CRISPR-associated protein Cas7/Csc2 [Roseomonas marmotae]
MTDLSPIHPFLGSLSKLADHASKEGKAYVQPALKNLGAITIPIIREVISPASFRNTDPEVTDITVDKVRRVRAVANKFKYGEKRRGLQVLRFFGAGGTMALNRTDFGDSDPISKGYNLNTVVFGDSANRGKYVLPVKAGVQYSDAISLAPYGSCVDETFHNRAAEDGSLWDSAEGKNSVNLFSRHYVTPGTLLLQVLTINGCTLPPEALEHLLLCVGLAGAYGGQTSIYGVNVRNHVVGIFGARMERAVASPYEAVRHLPSPLPADAAGAVAALADIYAAAYPVQIPAGAVADLIAARIAAVEADDAALRTQYRSVHGTVGAFFDAWFAMGGESAKKGSKRKPATTLADAG